MRLCRNNLGYLPALRSPKIASAFDLVISWSHIKKAFRKQLNCLGTSTSIDCAANHSTQVNSKSKIEQNESNELPNELGCSSYCGITRPDDIVCDLWVNGHERVFLNGPYPVSFCLFSAFFKHRISFLQQINVKNVHM